MCLSGDNRIGQTRHGCFEFFVRERVIFHFHGGLTARQRSFALWYGSLAPLHFALRDAVRGLREARRAEKREADRE